MLCRALLAAIAVTYILCVLIMNGLQKEDLDVSTLRKLQRHNVNIEDLNNETLREECEMPNRNSSTKDTDQNITVTHSHPDIGNKQDPKTKLIDSNLHIIFTNYFSNVNPNNGKVKDEDVEKFINVWNTLSRTKEYVEETTTKAMESSTVTMDTSILNRRSDENMANINKILQSYMDNQKITTTALPTTNIDYDLIAQKIKDLLAKDSQNTQKLIKTEPSSEEDRRLYLGNEEILHNASIKSIHDIIKLNNKTSNKNKNVHFENTNDEYQTEKRFLLNNASLTNIRTTKEYPRYKSNVKKEINSLSEDIIRELSENVREKVLQDLKKIIITTTATKKPTPTTKSTTVIATTTFKPTEVTTTTVNAKQENKEKVVTDVLEKFMEMFQQFKTNKEIPIAKNVVTEDNNIKTEDKTRHTVNVNVIKPIPVNITSVMISPYGPIHPPVIQTAVIPNQYYNLLNINTPLQNIAPDNLDHKITQLNNKKNIHTPPITIQTNSVEVPPLGLPAQRSFVYQNIVVTTKQPIEKVRHDFPYKSQDKYDDRKFDERLYDRNVEYPRPRVHYYTEFGIDKNERSRELRNERYSNEKHKRKPIKYKDYGRSYPKDHNFERFHEKLERADDWSRTPRDRYRSRESRNIDDDYSKPKLISRHQLPLNGAKKRSRFDDEHFKKFLKTQQKVNDMLERILATKTISNGPRSVETTVK